MGRLVDFALEIEDELENENEKLYIYKVNQIKNKSVIKILLTI